MNGLIKKLLCALLISSIAVGPVHAFKGLENRPTLSAVASNIVSGMQKGISIFTDNFPSVSKILGVIGFAAIINKLVDISLPAKIFGFGTFLIAGKIAADTFVGDYYEKITKSGKVASSLYDKVINFFKKDKYSNREIKTESQNKPKENVQNEKIDCTEDKKAVNSSIAMKQQPDLENAWNQAQTQVFEKVYQTVESKKSEEKNTQIKSDALEVKHQDPTIKHMGIGCDKKTIERRLSIIGKHLI